MTDKSKHQIVDLLKSSDKDVRAVDIKKILIDNGEKVDTGRNSVAMHMYDLIEADPRVIRVNTQTYSIGR